MAIQTALPPAGPWWRRARWPLAGMMLTQMTNAMFAVAVPSVVADLGVGLERAGWIISAYLLPAVLMPTWGAAGDHWGRWRMVRLGLLVFALGATIAGLASPLPQLIAGQVIQATGAAALNPNGTALIADAGGDRGRGSALGRLRAILSLAGIAGAPIGGLLVHAFGWHGIFVAPPVLAVGLALLLGRRGPNPAATRHTGARFDVAGALTLSVTLFALLAALSVGGALGWTAPPVLVLAGVALLGLAVIGPLERRQPHPLIAPALVRQPAYVAVVVTAFLQAFACFGTALLAPILVQRHFGLDPAVAGPLLAAFPVGMAASGLPGGRLADRYGAQATTIGSLLGVIAGLGVLAAAAWFGQPLLFVPGALLTGFSAGVGLVAMSLATLQVSGEAWRGIGMGLYSMISIMGDAVGIVLLTLPLAGRTDAELGSAFALIYGLAAGAAALALLPALAMRLRPEAAARPEPVAAGVADS